MMAERIRTRFRVYRNDKRAKGGGEQFPLKKNICLIYRQAPYTFEWNVVVNIIIVIPFFASQTPEVLSLRFDNTYVFHASVYIEKTGPFTM